MFAQYFAAYVTNEEHHTIVYQFAEELTTS